MQLLVNFDLFYELSSYIYSTHIDFSIQPVYVNHWLHNHLTNLCNVPWGIEICEKKFETNDKLRKHIIIVHDR